MNLAVIGILLLFQSAPKVNPTFGQPNPERWDRVYSTPTPSFSTAPNAFLVEVAKELKPGRALDIGMGQGRNSIHLAQTRLGRHRVRYLRTRQGSRA